MAAELVSSATSDKLAEMDWTKNIEICELVARDHRQAKDVIKAIKKRMGSKHSNTQLFAVMLLEMLINNIGEPVHKQVIDSGLLPVLVKIVKKKSENPVREKIFLLLDAAQTSVGGASGKFPQYYSSYYELVSAGVQFPQRPHDIPKPQSALDLHRNSSSNASKSSSNSSKNSSSNSIKNSSSNSIKNSSSNSNKNTTPNKETTAPQSERNVPQAQTQNVSDSSILQKAGTALEVLRDVLNTIDTQNPEGAKEEFTLDLVEQCSFQKQRVMHLAVTSRDEKLVSRAIELNEQLERVLRRHDALLSGRTMSTSNHIDHEHEEEEEEEQLFRRIRKGKACVRPDEEDHHIDRPLGLMGRPVPGELLHRPLIRPLTVERQREPIRPPYVEPKQETVRPLTLERHREPTRPPPHVEPKQETVRPLTVERHREPIRPPHMEPLELNQEANGGKATNAVIIPPPPAKHVEREKFFQDNKSSDGSSLNGHVRNLSLHSINASSSHSGDFSD